MPIVPDTTANKIKIVSHSTLKTDSASDESSDSDSSESSDSESSGSSSQSSQIDSDSQRDHLSITSRQIATITEESKCFETVRSSQHALSTEESVSQLDLLNRTIDTSGLKDASRILFHPVSDENYLSIMNKMRCKTIQHYEYNSYERSIEVL